MSRRHLALASLLLLLAVPVHQMQAQSFTSLGVAAGASFPTGDYKDVVKTGYNAYLTLDVHAPLSPVGLRFDGMFNELDGSSSAFSGNEKAHIWAATANVVFHPTDLVVAHPYVIGGLGYYHASFTGQPLGFSIPAENKMGFNAGVGLAIPLTGFKAFVEARYHQLFSSDEHVHFMPVSFGVVF